MTSDQDDIDRDLKTAERIVARTKFRDRKDWGPGEVRHNATMAVFQGIQIGRAQGMEMAEDAMKKAIARLRRPKK
jgi:hypothetical protein